jgi:hypothetical protein
MERTTPSLELAPSDQGTVVKFTQSGWKGATEMYAICNSIWGELIYRLRTTSKAANPDRAGLNKPARRCEFRKPKTTATKGSIYGKQV